MYTKEEIIQKVHDLNEEQPWWHDIELPFGIKTISRQLGDLASNHNEKKWKTIRPYVNINNKSILDIGCNEGFFSIELSKLRPKIIYAVDINEYRIKKARFVFDVLGLHKKNILLKQLDIFDKSFTQVVPRVDTVFALGILHRVPEPYALLEKLTKLGDEIFLEWQANLTPNPSMAFWEGAIKYRDIHNTGYFRPSITCVQMILRRFGFVYSTVLQNTDRSILHVTNKKEFALNPRAGTSNKIGILKNITRVYIKDVLKVILH